MQIRNAGFFNALDASGFVWRDHASKCPELKDFITSFKQGASNESVAIAKRSFHVKMNLSRNERSLLRKVQVRNVGYN